MDRFMLVGPSTRGLLAFSTLDEGRLTLTGATCLGAGLAFREILCPISEVRVDAIEGADTERVRPPFVVSRAEGCGRFRFRESLLSSLSVRDLGSGLDSESR